MVIPHLLVYKAPAFPIMLNYSPPLCSHLGIFFANFVLSTSNSVSFLAKVMWLSLDVFFPQFLIPSHSHSLNPFCIPEKFLFAGGTENENSFFPHRFPFAHTIPARSLWSKKPSHTVGVNSLLDSMAAFWAVLYLSDESIRSQVNHQSLQKRKHCSEMHLKIQKTFICSLPFNSKISSSKQASTWIKFLLWNKRLCALWNNMKAFFRPTSLISHRYNRSHTRLTY